MTEGRPKIGIALGAGAVRGMAHIGILKVLEENGLVPDFITGTSIGSIIGACYASGKSPEWIERFVLSARWRELLDFTVPKRGLLEGKSIESIIQRVTKNKNFSELDIPLRVIATDINNHERVVFKEGNVAKATRASMSIPGIFNPLEIDNKRLVDGDLVDPIPTDELIEMGADIVIAVDLSVNLEDYYMEKKQVKGQKGFSDMLFERMITQEIKYLKSSIRHEKKLMPKLFMSAASPFLNPKRLLKMIKGREMPEILNVMMLSIDILGNQLSKEKLKNQKIDVIIKPTFKGVKWADFDRVEDCINAGELAALRALPEIKKAIADYGSSDKK
jgi:NTE family protein